MKGATGVLSATVLVVRLLVQLNLVLVRIQQLMLECEVCVTSMFCFCVAEAPRINSHPQDLKDAVPGKHVMFIVEATGTEPLDYQWEWMPAMDDGEWQLCDVERLPGADSSTLTIPSVQKSNEGSYRCVVSNYVGNQSSYPARLSVGECTTETFTKRYNAKILHDEY